MLTAEIQASEIDAEIRTARAQVKAAIPRMMLAVGARLHTLARDEFDALSHGGTTQSGRRWNPLMRSTAAARVYASSAGRSIVQKRRNLAQRIAALRRSDAAQAKSLRDQRSALARDFAALVDSTLSEAEIGVLSGELRASSAVTIEGSRGEVRYRDDEAFVFDAARKLLPDPTPRTWIEAASQAAQKALNDSIALD